MGLRDLQRELQRDLLGEESAIRAAIVDAPPLPADVRLDIYRHAYRTRLIDALHDTYPVLHQLLGDETFMALGELFVAAHPSVHSSIRWYGRELADFLAGCAPFAEQPILSEVARFEWTSSEVFDAPDATPLDRRALETLDPGAWADLTLLFHPSLRRLELRWNTVAVWKAATGGEAPPDPEAAPSPWLMWRRGFENYFRSMDAAENAALDAALRGSRFAEVCAALTAYVPEDEIPLRAASLVGTWTESGIIVGRGALTDAVWKTPAGECWSR
jgi:hypothetical protein